jgi:hypothetical protein
VETKTDDIDIITLPGYKFVMKNRKKITKHGKKKNDKDAIGNILLNY